MVTLDVQVVSRFRVRGEDIRNARLAARLSVQEVADRLGCSRAHIHALERKDQTSMRSHTFDSLVEALGVKPNFR